jgi:hypothetical protein
LHNRDASVASALTAAYLNELVPEERQNVLCTVCAKREEIARNCLQTGTEVSSLLMAKCQFYAPV